MTFNERSLAGFLESEWFFDKTFSNYKNQAFVYA